MLYFQSFAIMASGLGGTIMNAKNLKSLSNKPTCQLQTNCRSCVTIDRLAPAHQLPGMLLNLCYIYHWHIIE